MYHLQNVLPAGLHSLRKSKVHNRDMLTTRRSGDGTTIKPFYDLNRHNNTQRALLLMACSRHRRSTELISYQYQFVKTPFPCILSNRDTVEFTRLGRCFLDWATAMAGEADRELTCVTFTCHSSGPI